MMYIGNKKIIISESLLIPPGETARLGVNLAEGDDLNLELTFIQSGEEKDGKPEKNQFRSRFEDNIFKFEFVNFNTPYSQINKAPVYFGDSNKGEPLTFISIIELVQGIYKIELQVMLEVSDA